MTHWKLKDGDDFESLTLGGQINAIAMGHAVKIDDTGAEPVGGLHSRENPKPIPVEATEPPQWRERPAQFGWEEPDGGPRDARARFGAWREPGPSVSMHGAEADPRTADVGPVMKYDLGKTRLELFPGDALYAISDILTFGAQKYQVRGWEKGMEWSRVFGALQRHLWAWWGGEKLDSETKKSHLWHAGCCMVFLIAYEIRNIGTDDRPGKPR